jgi:arabinofuranosyltransferase
MLLQRSKREDLFKWLEMKGWWLAGAAIVLLFARILWHATMAEDAYITFRVIDQFVQGNGLRWNIDERVQVYTHPLWMLLHIPFYYVWDNIFLITIGLSLLCAAVAVWLPLRTYSQPPLVALALFIAPLWASRSFIDYSTTGFENTLLHALFAWVGWILFRPQQKHYWFWLSLAVALSLTTRLDTVILYAPLGIFLVATQFRSIHWRHVFLGMMPIISWELFSGWYYGFLLPNTKYAKLDTGIALSEYIWRGTVYVLNLLTTDPLSAFALILVLAALPSLVRRYTSNPQAITGYFLCLALGAAAYCIYVLYIGGTRQSGRGWSLPIFVSLWLCYGPGFFLVPLRRKITVAVAAVAIASVWPSPSTVYANCALCFEGMAAAEVPDVFTRKGVWKALSETKRPKMVSRVSPTVYSRIGEFGYKSTPDSIIVDPLGIADPLMARLPSRHKDLRYAQHAWRAVPFGYLRARMTGDTSHMDPDLALYYKKLRLIVSGDLWDGERLTEIIKFNLGTYDDARQRYTDRMKFN